MHRLLLSLLLMPGFALCQQPAATTPDTVSPKTADAAPALKNRTEGSPPPTEAQTPRTPVWVVPAGTKIPVVLRQGISTKNAQSGDAIYGRTNFPVMTGDHLVIPDGTYVQGVVDSVKRAGRIKGTAQLQFHLTTLIYPNGYALNLAAAVDQVPGSENTRMKEPGTIQHDPEKGKDAERIARDAEIGATIGGTAGAVSGGIRGIGIGGLSGIAAGSLIAVLARGSDVHFPPGTVIDVELGRAIAIDPQRIRRHRSDFYDQEDSSYSADQPEKSAPGVSEAPKSSDDKEESR